ncbi:MAG: 3-dehydroquinate synthase family protein [Acidobacteriota bacterium]
MRTTRSAPVPLSLHPALVCPTLGDAESFLREAVGDRRPLLCTETRLVPVLKDTVAGLERMFPGLARAHIRGGERNKTRRQKEHLEDAFLAAGLDRQGIVLALGGGVVTDLAGFAAGTFMRGVPFVNLPTTLLGMVDASLGGKVAVNTPGGKNLVGLFHPPAAVCAVLSTLSTLPLAEIRSGLVECLKHGLIADEGHFEAAGSIWPGHMARHPLAFGEFVERSIRIKGAVVDGDPEERSGGRNLLNAGHTVGHALERLSNFRLRHGDAVAAGLCWEAALSVTQGWAVPAFLSRVLAAVTRLGLGPLRDDWSPRDILEAARTDKKNSASHVRYIPLGDVGRPALPAPYLAAVDLGDLRKARTLLGRA